MTEDKEKVLFEIPESFDLDDSVSPIVAMDFVEAVIAPPTFPCEVRVQFEDGKCIEGNFQLAFDEAKPFKIVPLIENLNSGQSFIALELDGKKVLLVSLETLLSIETDSKNRAVAELMGGLAYFDFVKIFLTNGTNIAGVVSFFAPNYQSRMSDFFNRPERFVGLEKDNKFIFIRKSAIQRIAFWEMEENL